MSSLLELEEILHRIGNDHTLVRATGNGEIEIEKFEKRTGFVLPEDMKRFYRQCQSARIFDEAFVILPLAEIQPAGISVCSDEESLPVSWFAFCDRGCNGDWIGIDLNSPEDEVWPIIDIDPENINGMVVLASNFTRFISDALTYGDEGLYWLGDEDRIIAEIVHHPSTKEIRDWLTSRENACGPEQGPEQCKSESCTRLRIPLSVFCRRHHVEVLNRAKYPEDSVNEPRTVDYILLRPWKDN